MLHRRVFLRENKTQHEQARHEQRVQHSERILSVVQRVQQHNGDGPAKEQTGIAVCEDGLSVERKVDDQRNAPECPEPFGRILGSVKKDAERNANGKCAEQKPTLRSCNGRLFGGRRGRDGSGKPFRRSLFHVIPP